MTEKKKKTNLTDARSDIKRKVMDAFRENPQHAFNYKRIAKQLNIKKEAIKKLVDVLIQELVASGDLLKVDRGKYKLNYKQQVIEGRIDMTNRGAGYLVSENLEEDIFIPPKSMNRALHGDRVKAGVIVRKKGKRMEAEVLEVVSRAKMEFVGTVDLHERFAFVIPDDRRMFVDFFLPEHELGKVNTGEKVLVRLVDWKEGNNNPIGKIIDVLGMAGENDVEMHAILAEFGLPYAFSKNVLDFAEGVPSAISAEEVAGRRDFRDKTTFTIDPEDAKDFDDALSIEIIGDNVWEIGVHIADVSHYIKEGSILDKEAYERATSVYLVDRVVPMLPERLSNDLCSLTPESDKLCFSAVFQMNDRAEIMSRWFGKTIIHSDKRFAYADAQKVIDTGKGPMENEILQLHDLAQILRRQRFQRGSIGFDSIEVKFNLDEKGNPIGVYIKTHGTANELIEEFMLLANREVAEYIGKPKDKGNEKVFVYRIHDNPDPEKLNTFKNFIAKFGYAFNAKSHKNISESFNQLFEKVAGKNEEYVIEQLAIRTMAKAVYSTDNIGHYGLSFPYYSHFTSPIRRYPDLIVHRLLQHYLDGGSSAAQARVEDQCKHCSAREKLAVEAERSSIKYKQVQYLKDRVGETFEGIISGMNEYGMFIELVENKCEGMVRLREITDDYYYFDNKNFTVTGTRTGKQYQIGDKIQIEIAKADLARKQLDFVISGEGIKKGGLLGSERSKSNAGHRR